MTKFLISALILFAAASSAALAGEPVNWQMDMQPAASPSAEHLHAFHEMMIYIIFAISIFVLILLVYVVLRYNKHVNPVPKQFSHNVVIEVLWTVIPVVILIVIAIPSFKMLYFLDSTEETEMTLKITGYQWYWGYEYPDNGGINFHSYMVPEADISEANGQRRLLSTDNVIVLPVDTNIQIQVTGGDVLHSWTVPALGVKVDAVPGRLNETWVRINKPGTYFGQCSELCGKDHAYMPIEIKAVPKEEFEAWVIKAKEEFALNLPQNQTKLAYLTSYDTQGN